MQIALLCGYPVLVHLAIILEEPLIRALAIILLTTGILYKGLCNKSRGAWLSLIIVSVVTIIIVKFEESKYVFLIPPILIPALIGGVFISTLMPGKIPLVTGIGEQARGPLSTEMKHYTKRVTQMWAVLLCIMTAGAVVLPIFAEPWLWSLATNFLNYILIAVIFVGEFYIRQQLFKEHDHPSFREYISIVVNAAPHKKQA